MARQMNVHIGALWYLTWFQSRQETGWTTVGSWVMARHLISMRQMDPTMITTSSRAMPPSNDSLKLGFGGAG